ncbi:MAG: threonylcarbamoyl-AMP synthase [Anaerotruncus sp.]|nr:threonylcarbamoyl-AMP synthase [Anaerotruncus sp.]
MATRETKLLQTGQLAQAAALLRAGKLVAIPTETVYGLAADALNPAAAAAIYAAKGRPSDNPLIVHVASVEEIPLLVRELPDALYRLAEAYWPGPMTVVLPKSERVPDETSGGLDTVAIRIPAHPVARELIRLAGTPLAAPSANLSGKPSPTCAQHCINDLSGRVDAILDGGPCGVGVESTVLTLCTNPPRILRPGAVTLEMLRKVLADIELDEAVFTHLADDQKAASPGMKYKHYAPKAKVVLVHGSSEQFRAFMADKQDAGALCFDEEEKGLCCRCVTYGNGQDAASQAQRLFDALRQLDTENFSLVYAHAAKEGGVGQAVYNRLLRAAGFEEIVLPVVEHGMPACVDL